MTVLVDALPWSSLQLTEPEIPWNDLRTVADAAVLSQEVRDRLKREVDELLVRRYAGDDTSYPVFSDVAVPAVFALAADRFDQAGRDDIARYLIDLLYRAGNADDDFLLDIVIVVAGRLGPSLIEPALELIESEGVKLECWFHLWSQLRVAEDADEATRDKVIRLCRRMLTELPDRYERFSYADAPAQLLGHLDPESALPLIRQLFARSRCSELGWIIAQLERREPPPPRIIFHPWIEPVQAWLPAKLEECRRWLVRDDVDDDDVDFDDLFVDDVVLDVADLKRLGPIGHLLDRAADVPAEGATRASRRDRSLADDPVWPAPIRGTARIAGRNDPCPCGSGVKFKKCCGR